MDNSRLYTWQNAWFRWSVVSLVVLTVLSMLVGFVWLPSAHADFSARGLWESICRAAGVPAAWSRPSEAIQTPMTTEFVLTREMANPSANDAVGRGATHSGATRGGLA